MARKNTSRHDARYSSGRQGGVPSLHANVSRSNAARYTAQARRSSRGSRTFTIVAILVLVAFFAGGAYLWLNRTVNVSVNGSHLETKIDSTLADIVEAKGLNPAAGDLVSVTGNVLEEGKGAPFSATVGGEELDAAGIDAFRAKGNENIVIGDGADLTEPSHEEERETQPKMEPYEQIGAITYVAQWPKVGKGIYTVGDVSGEAVLKEEVEPVQNLVIESINPEPEDGSKVVAITFDDGPSSYTQRYLDILDKYGIKATFFCLGPAADAYPELIQAIKKQGSQVASHTKTHGDPLSTLDPETLRSEITDAFDSIESAGGDATTVIRPPYGDFNNDTWLNSNGTLSASVIWNLDSEDWTLPGANTIVSNCTNGAYSGAIILMHDGGGNRDQDLEALPKIIENLQGKGYKFVTINELMAMDSRIPEDVASGNATMPEDCVWPTEMVESE